MVENNYGDSNMSAPLVIGTTKGRQEMARKRDEIANALFARHGGLEERFVLNLMNMINYFLLQSYWMP